MDIKNSLDKKKVEITRYIAKNITILSQRNIYKK